MLDTDHPVDAAARHWSADRPRRSRATLAGLPQNGGGRGDQHEQERQGGERCGSEDIVQDEVADPGAHECEDRQQVR